jgi:4-alpha-glucanotransferase
MDRIRHNMELQDLCRVDHFRGFMGYWEVPAEESTALNGEWVDGPGVHFFKSVLRRFPNLPIIAEDLGVITPDVREAMAEFDFPGMKLLLFAFGEDCPVNPYAPHNIPRNSVVFTGTHDNNTVKGWFEHEASSEDISRFSSYVGREINGNNVHWEMCRLAMMSTADMAILPMQDILGLGQEARMNLPSEKHGNWMWRMMPELITGEVTRKLRDMTVLYGRA